MEVRNLYGGIPPQLGTERFDTLVEERGIKIERIVSRGHVTPDGQWYDQERDEWVVLLQGAARLRFADREDPVELAPGDWLLIRAHERHRVDWTEPGGDSIWLAVHYAVSA